MTDVKKVAIALSGGIDSLVAGYILKQNYPSVFGIHFSTGYEKKDLDLSIIATQLDIEIKCINLASLFEAKIVNYFIDTYLSGQTPNPCILCNKIIKFGALLDAAKSLGADALATGHYVKKSKTKGTCTLIKGIDDLKEQSYFLSSLSKKQLENIIFPLGDLTKQEVRNIARIAKLSPIEKKESQDICFLKQESISEFINSKIKTKPIPGNIITQDGKIIGTHNGLHSFTIGQRRGINCPSSEPYYVKKIDINKNNLTVCFKDKMFTERLSVKSLNWIGKELTFPLKVSTKIRYNHKCAQSTIILQDNNNIADIIFDEKQFAITPGQTAVFYINNEVIGSGTII